MVTSYTVLVGFIFQNRQFELPIVPCTLPEMTEEKLLVTGSYTPYST